MSVKRGKYYWVRTEVGKEIAFKRDSGAWEMHGIDCTEDLRELILEVYEEVANEDSKQAEKALAIQGVIPSIYVVTYNDDYGRPIFDNCLNDLKIAKEYVNDHDYLRMDSTTIIKEIDFE